MNGKAFWRQWRRVSKSAARCALFFALFFALAIGAVSQASAAAQVGSVTGLPVPRFVSLKSSQVKIHEGPSRDHRTTWIYQRAGLPVEIIAEFETWRRIRDSEGAEGWVLHSLLSGKRTGLVAPWRKGDEFPLRAKPAADAPLAARLQSGVVGGLKSCNGQWCRMVSDKFDGWIEQNLLWGAYPGEKFE